MASKSEGTGWLFIYGLLRRGDRAHHFVEGLPWHGVVRTVPGYKLLACAGGEFPGLVADEDATEPVVGELVEVDDPERWAAADEYEGVHEGVYQRAEIELEDGLWVQAYLYTAADCDQLPEAGPDWQTSPLRLSAEEVERRGR